SEFGIRFGTITSAERQLIDTDKKRNDIAVALQKRVFDLFADFKQGIEQVPADAPGPNTINVLWEVSKKDLRLIGVLASADPADAPGSVGNDDERAKADFLNDFESHSFGENAFLLPDALNRKLDSPVAGFAGAIFAAVNVESATQIVNAFGFALAHESG